MEITQKHVDQPSLIDTEFQKLSLSNPESSPELTAFLGAVRRRFPLRDWLNRSINDLYSASVDFFTFISQRDPEQVNARVYNPNIDEHGWACGRTVLLLNCKDIPFIVDSVRMVVEQSGCSLRVLKSTVLGIERANGKIVKLSSIDRSDYRENSLPQETFLYMELSLIASEEERATLEASVLDVIAHCNQVVSDYPKMQEKLSDTISELEKVDGTDETRAFLSWLKESNFTFLGFRDFDLSHAIKPESFTTKAELTENPDAKLGIFKAVDSKAVSKTGAELVQGEVDFYKRGDHLCFSKSRTRCTVHRSVYPDYVVVKKYNADGLVTGECRFLGLYTYSASSEAPGNIPILRQKEQELEQRFGILPTSHDGKRLARLIDIHPKDELFQSSTDELYACFEKISDMDERDIVSLILRRDTFGRFVSCLVYVPREYYTTDLRVKVQELLGEKLHTNDVDSTIFFSESKHARAHLVFRLSEKDAPVIDVDALEKDISEMALGWLRSFNKSLQAKFGEVQGAVLSRTYSEGLPKAYQESFDVPTAVSDIETFESFDKNDAISLSLYQPKDDSADRLKFRVCKMDNMIELSDVIPILEHMGLRVLGEEPYEIERSDGKTFWIHDFQLKSSKHYSADEFNRVKSSFEEAFEKVWRGDSESDAFNRLILTAGLSWREVNLLRAYANYMKQTLFNLSLDYIADTLFSFPDITQQLISLFDIKFNPKSKSDTEQRQTECAELKTQVEQALDGLKVLNQDRVFRRYLDLVSATSRASFYQKDDQGNDKSAISLKLQPVLIADIPEPKPAYEFFVYSARVEGVHLRTSKVARGGLRWSDRQEDYRTEVLGLVKAQQVKNAVIVPSGAKGGFYAKKLPTESRAKFFAEGVECYKIFIRGLLDLTDNLIESELVKPIDVVCYDGDDAYLVVAADKGTATFSDIANEISLEKGHWLGDAFASGGSQGYDHKAMGITAKGAWVSVQRHFRELGVHTQKDAFSVVAIGDMGGDVFGNGMLCSDKIQLVAAFNHLNIFIDPNPDIEKSFEERKRLFSSSAASWTDYNQELISEGGGVFSRSEKFITLSEQTKTLLDTKQAKVTPEELIKLLLQSPVDLIWNGGIGTYVKSESESNLDVGDKANDSVRVNGKELRCKVFGEGGNLGMTQHGRIEYCLNGGACNTDSIDNSAGVDCSDHEVNIKILIDEKVASGDLSSKERNALLVDMTENVSELVLANNYKQTLLLSTSEFEASRRNHEYRRFIDYLEGLGRLNRSLEFLPSDSELMERSIQGNALTRPEFSVLMSYAKVQLKEALSKSNISDDALAAKSIFNLFPKKLHEKYVEGIEQHRLRKEIIATQLANGFINDLGITAYYRVSESTGSSAEEIVKAYVVAKHIFRLEEFQRDIAAMDYSISAKEQHVLLLGMARRVRRVTAWFLKNRRKGIDVSAEVEVFQDALIEVQKLSGELSTNKERHKRWKSQVAQLKKIGVDQKWHNVLSMPTNLYSGVSVVAVSHSSEASLADSASMFYSLMELLRLNWFANLLSDINVETYWQASARGTYIEDLELHVRCLSVALLRSDEIKGSGAESVKEKIERWSEMNQVSIQRWDQMTRQVESSGNADFAMCSVALKELADLVKATCD